MDHRLFSILWAKVFAISIERETWLAKEMDIVDLNFIVNIVTTDVFCQAVKEVTRDGLEGTISAPSHPSHTLILICFLFLIILDLRQRN